jgi:hypothetical protein
MNILTQIKYWIIPLILILHSVALSQIVIGTESIKTDESTDKVKEKANKTSNSNGLINKERTQIYISASPMYTFRTLRTNEGLFGQELGERANEVGAWVWNYGLGIRSPLNNHFTLEIGTMLSRNRETYRFEESDSMYAYQNTYRHVAVPIQLAYTTGNELSIYCAVGFMPKAFISQRQDINYKAPQGFEQQESEILRNGYNLFLVDAIMSLGLRFETAQNFGLFLMAEGMYQLNNNYTRQGPFVRNAFGVGLSFGMHFYM